LSAIGANGEYDADISCEEPSTESFDLNEVSEHARCPICHALHWKDCTCSPFSRGLSDAYKNGFNAIETSNEEEVPSSSEEADPSEIDDYFSTEDDRVFEIFAFQRYWDIDSWPEAKNQYYTWLLQQVDPGHNRLYRYWWNHWTDFQRNEDSPPPEN